ncbi:MAG: hypothetical protein DMG26_12455 [Acidobacteria bacterium]|nr:MAG: hypothetical protein DMG26_12455 [Acidobacteriota bacterium]
MLEGKPAVSFVFARLVLRLLNSRRREGKRQDEGRKYEECTAPHAATQLVAGTHRLLAPYAGKGNRGDQRQGVPRSL